MPHATRSCHQRPSSTVEWGGTAASGGVIIMAILLVFSTLYVAKVREREV